jgi:hypothetical protein
LHRLDWFMLGKVLLAVVRLSKPGLRQFSLSEFSWVNLVYVGSSYNKLKT